MFEQLANSIALRIPHAVGTVEQRGLAAEQDALLARAKELRELMEEIKPADIGG